MMNKTTGMVEDDAALADKLARWKVEAPSPDFVERIVAQASHHAQIHPFNAHRARGAGRVQSPLGGGAWGRRVMAQAAGIVLCVFLGVALIDPQVLGLGSSSSPVQEEMQVAASSPDDAISDDVNDLMDDVFDDMAEGLLL